MKIRTSELTGASLDWAVAKCEGKAPKIDCTSFRDAFIYRVYLGWSYAYNSSGSIIEYKPSTDWSQGGPIIDKLFIEFGVSNNDPIRYCAKLYVDDKRHIMHGSTHLIAAMRCYVFSKLGATVEVPDQLML